MMGLKKSRAAFAQLSVGRLLVALALLISIAMPAGAQGGWMYIYENDAGEWHLNLRSLEDHDSYVVGWVRIDLSNSAKSDPRMQAVARENDREPSYFMNLYGVAKGSRQISRFQMTLYDRNGRPIHSESGSGEWRYCIPDTAEEAMWEAIMDAAGD